MINNIGKDASEFFAFIKRIIKLSPKYGFGLYPAFIHLCYVLSHLMPRRRNLWVLACWDGLVFNDNTKHLFLHIHNNHQDITPVWLSRSRDIVKKLRAHGYRAYYSFSLQGIYHELRAGYIFLDHTLDFANIWFTGGASRINLWHGSPLKVILYDQKDSILNKPWWQKNIYRFAIPESFVNPKYVTAPSDAFVNVFSSAFKLPKERVIVTGYPRNDAIFHNAKGYDILDNSTYDQLDNIRHDNPKAQSVLYLPTFRKGQVWRKKVFIDELSDGELRIEGLELAELSRFLQDNNSFFIIKAHYLAGLQVRHFMRRGRILFLPVGFDVYPILRLTDILVTDFSSIYFDFLLTGKPIIFYNYDLERYVNERSLYFDYQSATPGPKAANFEELLYWLKKIIAGEDEYAAQRQILEKIAFDDSDDNSAERIYKFVKGLIK